MALLISSPRGITLGALDRRGFYGSRFAAPLGGPICGRSPGRNRCRPARLYAPHLQLHGVGAGADRRCRPGLCPIRALRVARAYAADLARDAGAAWARHVAELRYRADA